MSIEDNEEPGADWTVSLRESYDAVAGEYAARIYHELESKPFDCSLLENFAEITGSRGPVCDLGCGPGQIARYLSDRGLKVFGLDLSAGMAAQARRLNPGLQFVIGTMLALSLTSDSLGGIAAFYSIIHLQRPQLRAAFREMYRVLMAGGYLLLTFHLGTDVLHTEELWDRPVDLNVTLFSSEEVVRDLEETGLTIEYARERDPYPEIEYQSRRGYILARKP